MKRALLLIAASAAVYAIAATWAASRLPEGDVAMHINTAGQVDRYASRAGAVSTFIGLGGFLFGLAVILTCLMRVTPARWLNVPNKDYWMAPERAPKTRQMIVWDIAVLLSMPLVALSFVPVAISLATPDPAGSSALWIVVPIGVWIIAMISYMVWMVARRYRPPREQ
jgi:hypothetical protein